MSCVCTVLHGLMLYMDDDWYVVFKLMYVFLLPFGDICHILYRLSTSCEVWDE